jgi:DNA-binding GntR family transcriptional regulator
MKQKSMDDEYEKIEKEFLSIRVHDILLNKIIENDLKPGEKISIPNIAKALGVSRFPVANAVTMLQKEGFILIIPQSGSYIRDLSYKELDILYRTRAALERMIIDYVIELVDCETIKSFKEKYIYYNSVGSFDTKLNKEFFYLDVEFHKYLAGFLPDIVYEKYNIVCNLTMRSRLLNMDFESKIHTTDEIKQNNVDLHINVIEALLRKDRECAMDLIVQDIIYTRDNVLQFIYCEE